MYRLKFILLILMASSAERDFAIMPARTYPTVELRENCPVNTHVLQLTNETNHLTLMLLDLSGFETSLFEVRNQNIYTINEIDREKFIAEKKCLDRSYCKIDLHVLVGNGIEYWVIPIHIVDENDNKPEFRNPSIELKFREIIFGGYKIPFEGAKDVDEGLNAKIHYVLDCSNANSDNYDGADRDQYVLRLKESQNERSIKCFPLFDIEILSQSLSNQYDQLALRFNPSLLNDHNNIKNEYKLRLYAVNSNLTSGINLHVKVERALKKPKFDLNDYEFVVTESSAFEKRTVLGSVTAKSNDPYKNIFYKIVNKTNVIEINSMTGRLFISSDISYVNSNNEISLIVQASYFNPSKNEDESDNDESRSFARVKILFRLLNYVNHISLDVRNQSSLIYLNNDTYSINISSSNSSNFLLNNALFEFSIRSNYYPTDRYAVSLENYYSTFSLLALPSSSLLNHYVLKNISQLNFDEAYVLKFKMRHEKTQTIFTKNYTLRFIGKNEALKDVSSASFVNICVENRTYFIFDENDTQKSVGKLRVVQTNLNVSNFTNIVVTENQSYFEMNECQISVEEPISPESTHSSLYLCSIVPDRLCFNVTTSSTSASSPFSSLLRKNTFLFPPSFSFSQTIEIAIFIFITIFVLATITLVMIICRLKGFRLCLTIKNYLFYGKKYGIHNAQRLSSSKANKRVQSIIVRESQSPAVDEIKSKSFIFNINQLIEQETNPPSLNTYADSSPKLRLSSSSFPSTSSMDQEQKTISNTDQNNAIIQIAPSSSFALQETRQLLDMIPSTTHQDLYASRLASEV